MIQLKNVTKVYETSGVKTPALNGISLDIKDKAYIFFSEILECIPF